MLKTTKTTKSFMMPEGGCSTCLVWVRKGSKGVMLVTAEVYKVTTDEFWILSEWLFKPRRTNSRIKKRTDLGEGCTLIDWWVREESSTKM